MSNAEKVLEVFQESYRSAGEIVKPGKKGCARLVFLTLDNIKNRATADRLGDVEIRAALQELIDRGQVVVLGDGYSLTPLGYPD
jgi:hypothetical protein